MATNAGGSGISGTYPWSTVPAAKSTSAAAGAICLVASMSSDEVPLSSVRGKCTILHHSAISPALLADVQLARASDVWYFAQCFDKYTHSLFDVLPLEYVHNLSPAIMHALRHQHYTAILVEQGSVPAFTVRKDCHRCQAHIPPGQESVQCTKCTMRYHLTCMEMRRAPKRGYAWQCPKCAGRGRADALALSHEGEAELRARAAAEAGRQRAEEQRVLQAIRDAAPCGIAPRPHWPFRYFGRLSLMADLADPDDRGYPKAASRLGTHYQASVPEGPGDEGAAEGPATPTPESAGGGGSKRKMPSKKVHWRQRDRLLAAAAAATTMPAPLVPARTDEVLFAGPHAPLPEAEVYAYMAAVAGHCFPAADPGEWADVALYLLHACAYDAPKALAQLTLTLAHQRAELPLGEGEALVQALLPPLPWDAATVAAFEEAVAVHGFQLPLLAKAVHRSRAQTVLAYYKWKKSPRYSVVFGRYCAKHRPSKTFDSPPSVAHAATATATIAAAASTTGEADFAALAASLIMEEPAEWAGEGPADGDSDSDADSISESNVDPSQAPTCTNCFTTTAPRYKRAALLSLASDVFCLECVVHWRKHGALPVSERHRLEVLAIAALKKRRQRTDPLSVANYIATHMSSAASRAATLGGGGGGAKGAGKGGALTSPESGVVAESSRLLMGRFEIQVDFMPAGTTRGCTVCRDVGAAGDLEACRQCGMQVHPGMAMCDGRACIFSPPPHPSPAFPCANAHASPVPARAGRVLWAAGHAVRRLHLRPLHQPCRPRGVAGLCVHLLPARQHDSRMRPEAHHRPPLGACGVCPVDPGATGGPRLWLRGACRAHPAGTMGRAVQRVLQHRG
jgi:hypothetical protein